MYGETVLSRKSKTDKSIVTERKLKFRSNGEILCGARFDNFPEEIGVDPKEFLDAFKAGVEDANEVTGIVKPSKAKTANKEEKVVTPKKVEKEPVVEAEEVEEVNEEVESVESTVEELIEKISNEIEEKDLDNDDKLVLVKEFIALGVPKGNYKVVKDVDLLEEVLEVTQEF